MLVEIDIKPREVERALDKLSGEDREIYLDELGEMFTEVLASNRAGKHRVFMTRELCQWVIVTGMGLGKRDIERVLLIEERAWEYGNTVESVPCKLTVVLGEKEYFHQEEYHWQVSHKNFSTGFKLGQVQLIVENGIHDGDIFSQIFELESAQKGVGVLNFKPVLGGGNTMTKWFERQVELKELVLCIGDRDRLVPGIDPKNTLMKMYKKLKSEKFIGFATLTPGYSIENFFPLEIVESLATNVNLSDITELKRLIEEQNNAEANDCLWLFFNIKKGIKKGLLDKLADQKYWIANKYQVSLEEVKNIKFEGFGPITHLYLNSVEQQENFKEFTKSEYWNRHFSPWLEPILWFLCGEDLTKCE